MLVAHTLRNCKDMQDALYAWKNITDWSSSKKDDALMYILWPVRHFNLRLLPNWCEAFISLSATFPDMKFEVVAELENCTRFKRDNIEMLLETRNLLPNGDNPNFSK